MEVVIVPLRPKPTTAYMSLTLLILGLIVRFGPVGSICGGALAVIAAARPPSTPPVAAQPTHRGRTCPSHAAAARVVQQIPLMDLEELLERDPEGGHDDAHLMPARFLAREDEVGHGPPLGLLVGDLIGVADVEATHLGEDLDLALGEGPPLELPRRSLSDACADLGPLVGLQLGRVVNDEQFQLSPILEGMGHKEGGLLDETLLRLELGSWCELARREQRAHVIHAHD
jgi:hypothetical protein